MTVIENYEWYLGEYPLLKKTWKQYINYLKTAGESERVLSVYSRYCRLFIDDAEMLSEYEAELVKQSPSGKNVAHWWLDRADMDRHFGDFRDGRTESDGKFRSRPTNCEHLLLVPEAARIGGARVAVDP